MPFLLAQLRNKIREVGFSEALKRVYKRVSPIDLEQLLLPQRTREFDLTAKLTICIPIFTSSDVARLQSNLANLEALGNNSSHIEILIPVLGEAIGNLELPKPNKVRRRLFRVEDDLEMLALIAVASNVIIFPNGSDEINTDGDIRSKALTALKKLNIEPFRSIEELSQNVSSLKLPPLIGRVRTTAPLYHSLATHLLGGQYGYKEELEWDIVRELPQKFSKLYKTARIKYFPLSFLYSTGATRVARQKAVGKMYAEPYLNGDPVLDVGCDLRGVERFVGAKTQYVGVDMQGLPDFYIDLEKDEWPFEPQSFETVLCFEVLEHLENIHKNFDTMLTTARSYFIGSLFIESADLSGRLVNRFGEPLGNAHLPIAPVFDRHHWIFNFNDALDFIYYRARRAGFDIIELDLFYKDKLFIFGDQIVRHKFKRAKGGFLGKYVPLLGFVLQRRPQNGQP